MLARRRLSFDKRSHMKANRNLRVEEQPYWDLVLGFVALNPHIFQGDEMPQGL